MVLPCGVLRGVSWGVCPAWIAEVLWGLGWGGSRGSSWDVQALPAHHGPVR